jgi:hypothetical protein
MKLLVYVVIAIIIGVGASWFMNGLSIYFFQGMGFSVHAHGVYPSYLDVILIGSIPIFLRLDRQRTGRGGKLTLLFLLPTIVLAFWVYGTYSWVSTNAAVANNNVFYLGSLGKTDVTSIQAFLAIGCAISILISVFLLRRVGRSSIS